MNLTDARVLIVDDEVMLREIFVNWLRSAGCKEVYEAGNGAEALAMIETTPIDILISDVRMPVMDGLTLVRELAARGLHLRCVIFVTAFSDMDLREMYDLGVEAFLAKPFRLDELWSALTRALADPSATWSTPMDPAPRQYAEFLIDETLLDAGDLAVNFRLGRGGFSIRSQENLGIGKISFRCRFNGEYMQHELIGQGWVRWRSRTDRTLGIEFGYLESPGREWIVNEIAAANPRGFIPTLIAPDASIQPASCFRPESSPRAVFPRTG